jgi:3-isopropylmalate/(R)-2-methylmalate dehydratase large subunit
MNSRDNGIIHVVGPEKGLSLPGMTIVCGDSHTSTHGAMGAVAFGIGTSEVEMVMASQCILQQKPKSMRISINGQLQKGVTAKDVALYLMTQLTTSGATGYFVEYAGDVITALSMEGRLTLCNLSIEMGARGGFIAPDETTFNYIKGREYAPKGEEWNKAVAYWRTLKSGDDAVFDKELTFDAADIEPRITYGTNPGMGIGITESIPTDPSNLPCLGEASDTPPKQGETEGVSRALRYMGFKAGQKLLGTKVDYVFLGACTNGRIEDFRAFASIVKGRQKTKDVVAWLVPGSWAVDSQIREEGLDKVLAEAGFEIRQPGCSACLAMNDDKVPAGKLAVSTSNRNFEGRQGPGSRTILASPLTAAAAAVTGVITDPRELL